MGNLGGGGVPRRSEARVRTARCTPVRGRCTPREEEGGPTRTKPNPLIRRGLGESINAGVGPRAARIYTPPPAACLRMPPLDRPRTPPPRVPGINRRRRFTRRRLPFCALDRPLSCPPALIAGTPPTHHYAL